MVATSAARLAVNSTGARAQRRVRKDDHPSAFAQLCAITSGRSCPVGRAAQSRGSKRPDRSRRRGRHEFPGSAEGQGHRLRVTAGRLVAGDQVCDELDSGRAASDVANDVMGSSHLDAYHAGFFVGVSVAAFCPRHTGLHIFSANLRSAAFPPMHEFLLSTDARVTSRY